MRKTKIILIIILFFVGSLATFKFTRAQFSDSETVLGNSIQVGTWGITPVATPETTITPTPTETPSPEAPTPTPTEIIVPAPTETPTQTPTPTNTPTPTSTPAPTPITNHLVINEVYYDPDNNHLIGSEDKNEWVEIYNPTSNTVSLSGWSIKDNYGCDNLPGNPSLPASSFAIISTSTENDFKTKWLIPSGTVFIQLTGAAIGNGLANDDELSLRNAPCATESIVDHISWGTNTNGLNPSIHSVAEGHSIERNPDGKDTDTAADFIDQSNPSPGS